MSANGHDGTRGLPDLADGDWPVVIGAGPCGLAAAWALKRAGADPLVLERSDRVCSSWHGHYHSLELNSPRRITSLPGMRMERRLGRWVRREDFIGYVERYAGMVSPDIAFGTDVRRIDREGSRWLLDTSRGTVRARHVVVAVGINAEPVMPDWPGRDDYAGMLIHVRDYDRPEPYVGKDVLVVGLGTSGTDVALDLVRSGAGRVRISVRTPPLVYRRHVSTAILLQIGKHVPLPDVLLDRLSLTLHRWLWGDLDALGLERPAIGMATRVATTGHGATMDRGLIGALRLGALEIVPAVERFEGEYVVLANGSRVNPDVVIAATGQRPNLEPIVGHLPGVLDNLGGPAVHAAEAAPGLFFLGYRAPAAQLADMAIDARRVARRVTADRAHDPAPSSRSEAFQLVGAGAR